MSVLTLPAGMSVTASLYRPVPETVAVGIVSFTGSHDGVCADTLAANLILRMPALVAYLPDLLLPGAPVAMMLHITPPNGMVSATAAAWKIDRAMKRDFLVELISGGLPFLIDGALAHLMGAIAIVPNAPTPTTVQ